MLMVWDDAKRDRNRRLHGLDFEAARDGFDWASALVSPSHPGADGRDRFVAIGYVDRQLVCLVFSLLGTEALSAISLRPASSKERKRYASTQAP